MDSNLPLISIVMPSFNSAATIERAVESVMQQSYGNTEVVVVDNNSQDDTAGAVRRLMTKYGSRVRLAEQENKGVSSARNEGIKALSGEYFMSLDSDDYYDPDTVLTLYRIMIEDASDCVICGMRKVYENDTAADEEFRPEAFTGTLKEFADNAFTGLYDLHLISTHSNKLYKTAPVRNNGIFYNEGLAVNEDIDFVLRYLAVCSHISVTDGVFLNYVQHGTGQSLINTFQPHGLQGAVIVLGSCRSFLEKACADEAVLRLMDDRMFVHICSFAGLMYYRSEYTKAQKLKALEELSGNERFKALLARLKPEGMKNRTAHFLLGRKMLRTYNTLCEIVYKKQK